MRLKIEAGNQNFLQATRSIILDAKLHMSFLILFKNVFSTAQVNLYSVECQDDSELRIAKGVDVSDRELLDLQGTSPAFDWKGFSQDSQLRNRESNLRPPE